MWLPLAPRYAVSAVIMRLEIERYIMELQELVQAYMAGDRFYGHNETGEDQATATTAARVRDNLEKPREYFERQSGGGTLMSLAEEITCVAAGYMSASVDPDNEVCTELCDMNKLTLGEIACLGGILKHFFKK